MPHCRAVATETVDFPLDAETIRREVPGRRVHRLTEVMVLRNGADRAVVRVGAPGPGLLREVVDVELVAGPGETVHVDAPDVDVFNPSRMAAVLADHDARAVVVDGRYGYTGVALPEETVSIRVVDLVPPDEPRLLAMARALLDAAPPDRPVELVPDLVDAEAAAEGIDGPVLTPCRAGAPGPFVLDDPPELDAEEAREATVVGCPVSERVFKAVYGTAPDLVDVCPMHHAGSGPCLVRCCRLDGVEEKGDVVGVPWGASHDEVRRALAGLADRPGDAEQG